MYWYKICRNVLFFHKIFITAAASHHVEKDSTKNKLIASILTSEENFYTYFRSLAAGNYHFLLEYFLLSVSNCVAIFISCCKIFMRVNNNQAQSQ